MPQKELSPYETVRARMAARRAGQPKPRTWGDTARDYGESVYEGGRDMATGLGKMFMASQGDANSAMELGKGLGQTIEDIKQKPSETGMILGEQLTGLPFRQASDEIGRGEYAKAAGHATVPLLALGLGSRAMKGRPSIGSIAEAAPKPRPQLRLAEHAGPGGNPRFFAGEAGVADATQTYRRHTGNPNPYAESGTPTLGDVGEVVTLPPELAAQGYGPQGRPEISIGKQRTRAAQSAFEGIQAEKARQPKLAPQIGGRERLNMDVEAIGGDGFPDRGPSRQTPGIPSVEALPAQQPRQGYYPPQDPNVPGIGDVGPVAQEGPREIRLPAGHQSALRKMGVPEENIRSMSIEQADKALRATRQPDPNIPMARSGPKKNAYGKVPDPKEGNLGVATEQVKADLKSARPYKLLTDKDLETLGVRGDASAIKELIGRKRGEYGQEAPGAPVRSRPGDVGSFEKPRPSITDERGSANFKDVIDAAGEAKKYVEDFFRDKLKVDPSILPTSHVGADVFGGYDKHFGKDIGPIATPSGHGIDFTKTFHEDLAAVLQGKMRLENFADSAIQKVGAQTVGKLLSVEGPLAGLWEDLHYRDAAPRNSLWANLKNESGHALLERKPYKPIDFDKPIPGGGGKGNIFHRTVNKVFDTNFANWVNARNASKVEGVIKRREFADLDKAGFDGITAFQEGILKGGRFKDVGDYFNKKHEELSAAGVKLGFRENYLPQLWENPADDVFAVSKRLGLKPTFTLERVLENYQAGLKEGLMPKYKNIGELMGWYEGRANKAIADRQFFDHLRETKQILPEGKAPSEWAYINPDHFPVQKFKTARGEHVTKNYKAPPDVAKAINNYLGEGHEAFKWFGDKAAVTKNIVLSSGVPGTAINAHGFNISARNVMANGVIKGGLDAAKYLINTGSDNFIGRAIEKVAPWESARKFFDENLRDAADAAHHGLTVTTEDHIIGEKGSAHLLREPKTKPGKLANSVFNKFLKGQGKYWEDPLFQNVIPALKVKHWRGLADDLVKQGVEVTEAKRVAATSTNEIYGGINWEAMQRSRDLQNLMRGIVLAPDWFETQYRIGKGMANTLRDPTNPRGLIYKRTAAHLIAAYVAADVMNYAINDKHMWENETGHALDIKMGSVGGKTRYVRPFGTAADFARLPFDTIVGMSKGDLSAPGKILKNRMSTVTRPAADLLMNVDPYGNPIFGPDKFGRDQSVTQQLGAAGREMGSAVTPQYVKGPIDYATGKAGSAEEAILGSIEMPVRYARESTKRHSRYRPTRRLPTRRPVGQ